MSVVSKKYAAPDLWNRYSRLAAAHQTIMQLKALIWLPHNKTAFLTCLTQTGLRAPDGKAWSSRSLNLILNDLLAQKLLTDELGCVPTLLHPVSVEAVASSDANCMCQAIGTCFAVKPKSTYYGYREDVDAEAVCRLLRLAIYANDDAGFIAARDLYEKLSAANPSVDLVAGLFAAVPLAPDWLVSRRTAIRLALFDAKVSTFLGTGTPGPDSMAVIARYRAERAGASVPPVLLSYDLVAGHLVGIRNGIAGADGALRRALEGAVAFLEARNGDAFQHYRDALKQHRQQLGKRKVFLDGAHGLLFVLALLGANDAGVLAEAQAGLDIMTLVGHLALVRATLDAKGIGYEYLDGSTPAADRQRRVTAFQVGSADLFLISLRAGGTGLNLTAADYVVHLDPWWNPAVEDQASDRAHRIGQERPVTIYRLIMQDSIEERIVRRWAWFDCTAEQFITIHAEIDRPGRAKVERDTGDRPRSQAAHQRQAEARAMRRARFRDQ